MTELKNGHVNNIYVMAPRQTSYSAPKILPTQISKSNTTNIYTQYNVYTGLQTLERVI